MLGVEQGHLSLFAKITDEEKKVQVIINTASTIITAADFKAFAEKYAPGYKVMEF